MKRIAIILAALIVVCLSGCAKSSGETKKTVFEQFEDGMEQAGLTYDEKVTMAADFVGAVEGYKYKFANGEKVEIYRFDEGSQAIQDATENKSIYLESFGSIPAEINGNLALLNSDGENGERFLEIFSLIEP